MRFPTASAAIVAAKARGVRSAGAPTCVAQMVRTRARVRNRKPPSISTGTNHTPTAATPSRISLQPARRTVATSTATPTRATTTPRIEMRADGEVVGSEDGTRVWDCNRRAHA